MTPHRRRLLVFVLLALLALDLALAGCGAQFDVSQSSMTEAQRDSAIARSDIPGAQSVKRAFKGSARVADLNARLDSL
jgi:hypothetical protein